MPDLYIPWTRFVLDHLRNPALEQETECERRLQALRERRNVLQQPCIVQREIAELERQVEQLTAESSGLERQIHQCEEELNAELDNLLERCQQLLQLNESAQDQELLDQASRFLRMPELLGDVAPVILKSWLREHPRPGQVRQELKQAALAAHAQVQAHADLRGERDELIASLRASREAIERARQELVKEHGVKPEVLAAIDALVRDGTDESFLEYLARQAADARAEAGWRLPKDVFGSLKLHLAER